MPLLLDIVTPEKKFYSGEVDNVYLPGTEGELGILPGHVPLVTGIEPGELRYAVDGQVEELAIGAGFLEVSREKVTVLTDLAVTDAEIDESKVEEAIQRAEESLSKIDQSANAEEVAALQSAIAKSMAQLKLKRKRRQV
ncbi:MAG: ATP synthase F1 subunit epsilon [Verrucomicrobiaceae bacterium]|nr:ATP synthase F1 subunit epsilon [Verrucomicrobiaceae bacterium]